MTQNKTKNATSDQSQFWNATRDEYLVHPALREPESGNLYYPHRATEANRWVIVRELNDEEDPHEIPTPVLVGEFDDEAIAEHLCDLIRNTAGS